MQSFVSDIKSCYFMRGFCNYAIKGTIFILYNMRMINKDIKCYVMK